MLKIVQRIAIVLILVVASLYAPAQTDSYKPKSIKFGKIDPEEFNIKPGGADSAAAAVAIFDVGQGYFETNTATIQYVMERHTRIKIINKSGYDYANLEIQLYRTSSKGTTLSGIEACTYNMENGKMVVSKIGSDAKFTERQDKNYSIKKFALPNIKEGSIVEFKYKIKTDYFFRLPTWYFQRHIPTIYSEYVVSVPDFFNYKAISDGLNQVNSQKEIVTDGVVYKYVVNNVPGLRSEKYVANMDDYLSRVNFEIATITRPGEMTKDFTSTWPKIIRQLKDDTDFGGFINKDAFTKPILATLIKAETNQDSIVTRIFNYVKNNIKWNKEYDMMASEFSPKTVLEKKIGNSADINLCLLVLLNAAKLNASPVLLSTRKNGKHPGFPMISAFNNVIVNVVIGEKQVLLDATDKNHCPNLIAYNDLNHEGLLLDLAKETSEWISLEKEKISSEVYNYLLTLNEDNKLTGKLFITSTEYIALAKRKLLTDAANESEYLKDYKDDKPGLALKNYQLINLNNTDAALSESMDIQIEDNVDEGGNLAFFTPLLFERTKDNPFKLDDRKFPVDFGFPSEETFRITIELPKNYVVDKLPTSEKFVLPSQAASFSFIFSQTENKIGLISKISIKKSLFTPEEYFDLQELFKNIVRKQAEQVVIKKS
ncbi:DUF3857 domain-containing protein [Pedobacter sp. PWIIR3]